MKSFQAVLTEVKQTIWQSSLLKAMLCISFGVIIGVLFGAGYGDAMKGIFVLKFGAQFMLFFSVAVFIFTLAVVISVHIVDGIRRLIIRSGVKFGQWMREKRKPVARPPWGH